MNQRRLVFAQLTRHLPLTTFRRCVAKYAGKHKVKSFACLDQYLCTAFAQITSRESLRDIEACLRAQITKLDHMGIRGRVSRSTLADANEVRDWRIYAEFAQRVRSAFMVSHGRFRRNVKTATGRSRNCVLTAS